MSFEMWLRSFRGVLCQGLGLELSGAMTTAAVQSSGHGLRRAGLGRPRRAFGHGRERQPARV